jgi:hypothetical protein
LAASGVTGDSEADCVRDLGIKVKTYWVLADGCAACNIKRHSVQLAEVDGRRWIESHFPGSNIRLSAPRLEVDGARADLFINYSKSRTEGAPRSLLSEMPRSESR